MQNTRNKEPGVKILMITSEAVPFAKSGGLGDAVSSLAKALKKAGADVRIMLPRYYSISKTSLKSIPGPMGVPMGDGEAWCAVLESTLPNTDVPVYFIDHEGFFGRDGIYGDKTTPDYPDNPYRFAFFCRSAFQLCRKLGWFPDIMHAHDWPASLISVYKQYSEVHGEFSHTHTVFTIHNLGYQGIYHKDVFPYFGLPWEAYHGAGLEYYGSINILQSGIATAEKITTVSPTYAREIQTSILGCTMDGLLRSRSSDLVGILNGADYDEWNPETDKHIPARYSTKDMSGKAICKEALQREFGLEINLDVPVIGMIARLTDQKGIGDLFGPMHGAAYQICTKMNVQFVVVGSGDAWCERELISLNNKLSNFKAKIGYFEKLAHLIEAGADFFMMPSRYEPCGLNQLYSLRYGTLPIVRRTGGLADTVSNYNEAKGTGTGFVFDDLTPQSIFDTTGWAVYTYYNKREHFNAMRITAMNQRFSWDKSVTEYMALYSLLVK